MPPAAPVADYGSKFWNSEMGGFCGNTCLDCFLWVIVFALLKYTFFTVIFLFCGSDSVCLGLEDWANWICFTLPADLL